MAEVMFFLSAYKICSSFFSFDYFSSPSPKPSVVLARQNPRAKTGKFCRVTARSEINLEPNKSIQEIPSAPRLTRSYHIPDCLSLVLVLGLVSALDGLHRFLDSSIHRDRDGPLIVCVCFFFLISDIVPFLNTNIKNRGMDSDKGSIGGKLESFDSET